MEDKTRSRQYLGKSISDIYEHKDNLRILILDNIPISIEDEHAINNLQLDELYLSNVKLKDIPDERRQNIGWTMIIKIPTLKILSVDRMAVQIEDGMMLETLIMSRSWENKNITRFSMPNLSRLIARDVKFSKPISDEFYPSLTDINIQKVSRLELIFVRCLNIEIVFTPGYYQDINLESCPNAKIRISRIDYNQDINE